MISIVTKLHDEFLNLKGDFSDKFNELGRTVMQYHDRVEEQIPLTLGHHYG
jgi:hypothetical protein